jgi:hypothetical protein
VRPILPAVYRLSADPDQVPRKSLNPAIYREFELKEKTIITHNTAMYDRHSYPSQSTR